MDSFVVHLSLCWPFSRLTFTQSPSLTLIFTSWAGPPGPCLLSVSAAEAPPLCPRPHGRLSRPGLTMALGLIGDNINISLARPPSHKYWSNVGHQAPGVTGSLRAGWGKPWATLGGRITHTWFVILLWTSDTFLSIESFPIDELNILTSWLYCLWWWPVTHLFLAYDATTATGSWTLRRWAISDIIRNLTYSPYYHSPWLLPCNKTNEIYNLRPTHPGEDVSSGLTQVCVRLCLPPARPTHSLTRAPPHELAARQSAELLYLKC